MTRNAAPPNSADLSAAAARGDLAALERALACGPGPLADFASALQAAAANGRLEAVALLHRHGADLRAQGDGAIRLAAANGHVAVVRYLHQNGANIGVVDGEVLRGAAASRRGNLIRYLHPNGIVHALLSQGSRDRLQAMADEIRQAPPVYHPSRFWEAHVAAGDPLLTWGGEENFKRTLNQYYFNFIPRSLRDPRVRRAARLWPRYRNLKPLFYSLEDPDCDPGLWLSWYPDYFIFKGDRSFLLRLYKWFVASCYEYTLRTDPHGLLARLEEPELGNPIRLRRDGRLISQDLVNSVRERNAIVATLGPAAAGARPWIAELGAGYGRLGHVLLATTGCRYAVFDIPPALHLAEWYLSRLFPDRRIAPFRRSRSPAEVAEELARADIAFFTPNQLALVPDRCFDAFATISSLHEMRPEQIEHFLRLMAAKTCGTIYVKQQSRYVNPHDGLCITRDDYAFPPDWRVVADRPDALHPDFFELVLHRRDVPCRRDPAVRSAADGGRELTRPELLIFFHIGKTAGVTLGGILARHFPEPRRFDANVGETRSALGLRRRADIEAAYRALPETRRWRTAYVGGHITFGIHEFLDRPSRYITLLRHPVDRVVSSFYYLRQTPGVPIHPAIKDMGIEAYLESRLGLDPYDYQVRALSGCPELDMEWKGAEPLAPPPVTEAHLEQAKRNIEERFLFVGTSERFDEAVVLLRRLYGWRLSGVLYTRENITAGRPRLSDLSARTVAEIRRHNVLDQALYDWAAARFDRLVRDLGVGFRLEVWAFKGLNGWFQRQGRTRALNAALAIADLVFG